VAALALWRGQRRRGAERDALLHGRRAGDRAIQALREARRFVYGHHTVGQVLLAYLAERLDQPVQGLTHTGLAALLEARNVPGPLAGRVQDCLVRSEAARFAPDDSEASSALLEETSRVISELEALLSPVGQDG
jgi:hypothetical protein